MNKPEELTQLTQEVKSSVALALVAVAPSDLIDRLAVAAGLLDAITEMALDAPAAIPLVATTVERANRALAAWCKWQLEHPPNANA